MPEFPRKRPLKGFTARIPNFIKAKTAIVSDCGKRWKGSQKIIVIAQKRIVIAQKMLLSAHN
ncbi:hypothetical protein CYJ36_22450 [Bacillus sp. UMB0893]|nr:hypothetical protein CYJ36_22450 [Bacillus sp. UMB0893]